MRNQTREVVMIGHKGHPEVEGTMGQSAGGMYLVETVEDVARLQVRDPAQLSFVTQTTLSIDDKYADDLVNYVMARAYMKESEFAANANLSAAHTNLFTSSVNAQSVALTGVNPNLTTLPMTPAVPAAAR